MKPDHTIKSTETKLPKLNPSLINRQMLEVISLIKIKKGRVTSTLETAKLLLFGH